MQHELVHMSLANRNAEAIGHQTGRPEHTHADRERNAASKLAWLQVIGSFCLNLNTWGLLGSFGVYQSQYSLKTLRGYSDSEISWIGSVQGFFMFFVSFLIGPIFDAGYLHSLLLLGTSLSVLGLLMTSLCKTYWQIFLAQGAAMGIGFGCIYLPAPALIAMHFQRHQALAMGLSSSGSGIGAVMYPLVFTHLEPSIGFAWATRVLGFILLVTSIIPLAVMRFPKRNELATPSRDTSGRKPILGRFTKWLHSLIDKAASRDTPFMLLVMGLMTTFMGIYVMLYYINLLTMERTHVSQSLARQSLTIVNGASTVGRILPSALADYVGPVHILALSALLSGLTTFCLLAAHHAAPLIIWTVAFGSFAGVFMGLPAAGIVSVSNSTDNIGKRLGMTLGIVGCGVLVAEPIAGAILGARGGGWVGLVAWSASLMMAGCVFVTAARITKAGSKILVKI